MSTLPNAETRVVAGLARLDPKELRNAPPDDGKTPDSVETVGGIHQEWLFLGRRVGNFERNGLGRVRVPRDHKNASESILRRISR